MLLTSRYWKYEKRDERAEILEIQMSKPESGKPILKLNLGQIIEKEKKKEGNRGGGRKRGSRGGGRDLKIFSVNIMLQS